MSAISEHRQKLEVGAEVLLYILDLTPIGVAEIHYFTNSNPVSFDGQAYEHVPVELTEVERNATGEMVAPKFSIPNVTKFASALVVQHRDGVGAELTRIRTYEKFLDGQPGADPEAIEALDVFVLEQKLALNKVYGQWELRVLADTGDRKLPGRTCMKDICPFAYRLWDADNGVFVTPKRLPCPYASMEHMFTIDNEPTADPALDACDHTVAGGCLVRTPGWPGGVLQFGGFPGMSRYRM